MDREGHGGTCHAIGISTRQTRSASTSSFPPSPLRSSVAASHVPRHLTTTVSSQPYLLNLHPDNPSSLRFYAPFYAPFLRPIYNDDANGRHTNHHHHRRWCSWSARSLETRCVHRSRHRGERLSQLCRGCGCPVLATHGGSVRTTRRKRQTSILPRMFRRYSI